LIQDKAIYTRARNIGADVAAQPLLIFLDADVILPAPFLEKTISEMLDRDLDIASCYVKPLSTLRIDHLLHGLVNYYLKLTQRIYPHIPGFCIFVTKDLHQRVHGFDESLILCEDHDYVRRASKMGKFAYLNSYKIPVSVRRLAEDGRFALSLKYFAFELQFLLGRKVRKQFFTYKFGQHYK
jgi:GT2 family glycosyltransferase